MSNPVEEHGFTSDHTCWNLPLLQVIAPLALGSHANVVYVVNQGQGNKPHPIAGILKRYGSTAGSETVLLTAPRTSPLEGAQVSADGQWVLFST